MKKILFAALAALAITSCSQNEIDGIDNGTPKSKNEIGQIAKVGATALS